ncbi:hypothetical protein GCM10022221_59390 [Actinocorallia aurea]
MHDWRAVLGEVTASQERLEQTLDALDDAALRAPSPLAGWTRGHVVHHLARNADSYSRLLEWAATGVVTPQYASAEARETEIADGADLSHAVLAADVRESAARFAALALALPETRWDARRRGARRVGASRLVHAVPALARGRGPPRRPERRLHRRRLARGLPALGADGVPAGAARRRPVLPDHRDRPRAGRGAGRAGPRAARARDRTAGLGDRKIRRTAPPCTVLALSGRH